MDYNEYLASPAWRAIRKWVQWRSCGLCEVPGCSRPMTETHHCIAATGEPCYVNLYCEGPGDVLGVCSKHHEMFHRGWRIESGRLVAKRFNPVTRNLAKFFGTLFLLLDLLAVMDTGPSDRAAAGPIGEIVSTERLAGTQALDLGSINLSLEFGSDGNFHVSATNRRPGPF